MEYLIVAVVGYMVGYWVRGIVVLFNLSRDPAKIFKMLEEIKDINEAGQSNSLSISKKDSTELFIERVGNNLYAYNKETNQFVAQASDLKTLLDTAHKRFPTEQFFGTISKDNPAKELAQ